MGTPTDLPDMLQKALLICGILCAVLSTVTDIVAGLMTEGYRFDTQSASILSGIGTPTRWFVLPVNLIAGVLMLAFATGVWFAVGANWALRLMACMLALNAILTMVAVAFFPSHPAELVNSPANKVNVMFMAPAVIVFLLAIILGAIGNHNWFRYYSIATLLLFLFGAILSILVYYKIVPGQPGTTVGIQERTMIYAEMLWLALQAVVLLRL